MLGKIKGLFGAKTPAGPKLRRINLERRFTTVAEFSQGSMSRVYRAVDNDSGRTVCLKVQDREKTRAALARAAQGRPTEGEIGTKIVHPNVVQTLEYGETTRGEYYIVTELIEGVSLQFLRESRALSFRRKVLLLIQAAEGLAAVHRAGFIHHDFGPKNMLVDREKRLKIIDFGLAIPNTPAFRRPGNRTGTLLYMAPELVRREPIDERIDIFSFGVTAFELLTDRHPYDAAPSNSMAMMLSRMNSDPLDPVAVRPNLDPRLCAILRKATARRKDERYASMAEIAEDLKAVPLPEKPEKKG